MEVDYTPKPPELVQLRERGQLTIPAEIRREMGVREGDVFSIVRVGDSLVVTRKRLLTPEIARKVEALMQETGRDAGRPARRCR